jgi:hypothetical protein
MEERRTPKNLKVFYGFSKQNNTIKKRELAIYFENDNNNSEKNLRYINQRLHLVYTRKQTKGEAIDSSQSYRMFTKYGYFLDEKRWNSDIDAVLRDNFIADENNVSEKERLEIKSKLLNWYLENYSKNPKVVQLSMF